MLGDTTWQGSTPHQLTSEELALWSRFTPLLAPQNQAILLEQLTHATIDYLDIGHVAFAIPANVARISTSREDTVFDATYSDTDGETVSIIVHLAGSETFAISWAERLRYDGAPVLGPWPADVPLQLLKAVRSGNATMFVPLDPSVI